MSPKKKTAVSAKPKSGKAPTVNGVKSSLGNVGSLLGNWPQGFENGGKRLLAECPEFKLWELYHEGGPQVLETSEEIKTAEYKALWHSRDKDDDEPISIRIDRCIALHYLLRFKELGYSEGGVPTAKKMAETFMPLIEEALKADNTDQATTAADRAGNKLKGAILTLRRKMERKQSEKRFPAKVLLIRLAEGSFQYSKVRPRKSELQQNMEMLGYTFGGKDSAGKWRELFETSKLENLPE